MTTRLRSVLRRALDLLTIRLVLEQIGLAMLVSALFAAWLRVPDASALDLVGSVLLALVMLGVAGAGESYLMLGMCGFPRSALRLLRGALIAVVAGAVSLGCNMLLVRLEARNGLRAGYLNSRFPHSMRGLFSYGRILLWLGWTGAALRAIGAGLVAVFAFAAVTSFEPIRSVRRELRCGTYWVVLLLGSILGGALTGTLLQWTPGHGVGTEMLSLALRLVVVLLVDGALASLLLTILAVCVRETDLVYAASGGTPDDSQPRTAESP